MRIKLLIALLGLSILLFTLAGCTGNNSPQTFTLNGRVVDSSGVGLNNATVALVQNGTIVATTNTSNGNFVFTNLTPGTFTVEVAGSATNVRTVSGPIVIPFSGIFTIVAPAQNQLPGNVTTPINGTATLVVEAKNPSGAQVQQFSVKVGALATVTSTLNNPAFAVVTGIPTTTPPTGVDIVVTNTANGGTVTLKGVKFTTNTVSLLNVTIPNGTVANTFSASGTVENGVTAGGVQNINIAIRAMSGFTAVSNNTGAFAFVNVPAGAYSLQANSNASAVATTFPAFAGPFSGTTTAVALSPVFVLTQADLPNVNAGITVPTNGTATLVVYAIRGNTQFGNVTVHALGQTATGASPVVLTGLTATPAGTNIEVLAGGGDVILNSIPLPGNNITVVTAYIP